MLRREGGHFAGGKDAQTTAGAQMRQRFLERRDVVPLRGGSKPEGIDADAVVVGSVIVNQIARCGRRPDLVLRVTKFVKSLVQAVKKS